MNEIQNAAAILGSKGGMAGTGSSKNRGSEHARRMSAIRWARDKRPVEVRLWEKIDKRSQEECWPWIGKLTDKGYARFTANGKETYCHRLAWEFFNGKKIPDGLDCLHKCDNPKCCNPYHLFIGTHNDNMQDMVKKRRNPRKLSDDRIREIRALVEGGMTKYAVSKRFGMFHGQVGKIVRKEIHKYVI